MNRTAQRVTAACAAAVGLAVLVLAGAALTHRIAFVSTHGVSMNPVYHQGDLVVVRREKSYQVGQIVAYSRPDVQVVVLHRVVGRDAQGLIFKGDNNQSVDPPRPADSRLLGRAVLHVPGGGVWARRAISPAFLAGLAFLVIGAGGTAASSRRSARRRASAWHATPTARRGRTVPSARRPVVASAVAVSAGLLLAAVAHWSPAVMRTSVPGAPSSATFSYQAAVPRSPAYDGTVARAPDPIFRRLAQTVTVRLDYVGPAARAVTHVDLSNASGWHSRIPVTPVTRSAGEAVRSAVVLDLLSLEARAHAAAAVTGIVSDQLQVSVVSDITTDSGAVFSPRLDLALTPLRLALADGAPLVVRSTGKAASRVASPGQVAVLGETVAVPVLRWASGALIAVGLLVLVASALTRRGKPLPEDVRIRRRFAAMLLAVHPVPAALDGQVVVVADFAALTRVAERYDSLILHWSRSGVASYLVHVEDITYLYRTGAGAPTGRARAEQPGDPSLAEALGGRPVGP